jgi:hypothetical protein
MPSAGFIDVLQITVLAYWGASSIFTVNAFQGGQDRLTNAINIGQFDT